jgi:4-diphosphocytidyl-2-C-methyl-D-erythritol kinase
MVVRHAPPPLARAAATAKINVALVVGPRRADGKHEVTTLYQRIALADRVTLEPSDDLTVEGFAADTLVRRALESLAAAAATAPAWRVRITKRIPVAAGLGGGSSDAAAALRLANDSLPAPLAERELHRLAASLGADVPFFLTSGPQLGTGDGSDLAPVDLPQDFAVVLVLPRGEAKHSTKAVYGAFDDRNGAAGYDERRAQVLSVLENLSDAAGLGALPPNDLTTSPVSAELQKLGAFRADVSGAGPAVYGLFASVRAAREAARRLRRRGRVIVTTACWYG